MSHLGPTVPLVPRKEKGSDVAEGHGGEMDKVHYRENGVTSSLPPPPPTPD